MCALCVDPYGTCTTTRAFFLGRVCPSLNGAYHPRVMVTREKKAGGKNEQYEIKRYTIPRPWGSFGVQEKIKAGKRCRDCVGSFLVEKTLEVHRTC